MPRDRSLRSFFVERTHHEYITRARNLSSSFEQLKQIVELTVNVPTYLKRIRRERVSLRSRRRLRNEEKERHPMSTLALEKEEFCKGELETRSEHEEGRNGTGSFPPTACTCIQTFPILRVQRV